MNAEQAEQTELPLRAAHRVDEAQIARDVEDFDDLLLIHGTLSCRAIEALRPEWASPDGRYVRLLASRSTKVLSAPGIPYTHEAKISLERLAQMIASLRGQVRAMGRTLVRLIRLHGLRRAAAGPLQNP